MARQKFKMGTWLDPEEYAYPSGSLRDSRRRFRAIMNAGTADDFVDGIAGIPDTYFTIPARGTYHGHKVRGYVSVGGHLGTGEGVLIFHLPTQEPDDDDAEENPAGAKMPQAFDYNDAAEVLDRSRRGKLGANTEIYRDAGSGDIHVRLYNTNIITYRLDGGIVLNSGGHRTATTKARINAFLSPRIQVYAQQGTWWVQTRDGRPMEFEDGMIVEPPRENPRRHPGYKGHIGEMPEDRFAYRGYYVQKRLAEQYWDISKDGFHIGGAASPEKAREIIADLTRDTYRGEGR